MGTLVGNTIRSYQLSEQIGAGVSSLVYRARRGDQGDVAIKIVLPEFANRPEFIRRFEAEVRLAMRLKHPHIVTFTDYWRDPSGAYLVMPLFTSSLREVIDTHTHGLPQGLLLRVLDQLSAAMMVAHREGIVHRDIKPGNILMDEDNNAYLSDFGIAKIMTETDEWDTSLQGTLAYIAPEQLTDVPITPQTDIYALGIVAYEMLTGQRPFMADNAARLIREHVENDLPSVQAAQPGLPQKLDIVLKRATVKHPTARYATARDFFMELQAVLTGADLEETQEIKGLGVQVSNPYKGLWPFEEADTSDFFGREAVVDRLLARLNDIHDYNHFLALVGAVGVGKSSILNAGLIPALRNQHSATSKNWYIAQMMPNTDPLRQLHYALLALAQDTEPGHIDGQLAHENISLQAIVDDLLPDDGAPVLLVIDQFEEVFYDTVDDAQRVRFLELVRQVALNKKGRIWVLIALRADFTSRILQTPGYGDLMQQRTEFVLLMAPHELEAAIIGPAQRIGLEVDRDLQKVAMANVRGETDALSLLQFALLETYATHSNQHLTLAGYMSRGGALKALSQRCEEIHKALDADGQETLRILLTQLAAPKRNGQYHVVRQMPWQTLNELAVAHPQIIAIKDDLVAHRILFVAHDPQTREPILQLPNETLLHRWERLRTWLADDDKGGGDALERRLIREGRVRLQLQALVAVLVVAIGLSLGLAGLGVQQAQQDQQNLRQNLDAASLQANAASTQVAVLSTEVFEAEREAAQQSQDAAIRAAEDDNRRLAFFVTQALVEGDRELALALAVAAVDVPEPSIYALELLAYLLDAIPENGDTPDAISLLNMADKDFGVRDLTCEERAFYRVAPLCEA